MEEDSRNSKAEALYQRHHREVYQYILRAFGFERTIVDDLTLEVFVRLWQSARLDSGPVPRAYVYVVARNTCFQYRRNSGRKKRDVQVTLSIEELSIGDGVFSKDSSVEDVFALGELLQRLPEREREAITLVDGASGFTIEEAAGIMRVSRRSARHLREKGLKRLEQWGQQLSRYGGLEQHAD